MLRLSHVSDVHIFCPEARWALSDWFSRRLAGWANVRFLSRGHHFRDAVGVLRALATDVQERRPDCLIFSGDATALGTEEEFALSASLLRVGDPAMPPGLAVPGNHDYYTFRSMKRGHFEKYFAPWLVGERVDEAMYPFARKVGPVYLIALNSAKPNRWFWDATGRVARDELDRLRRLCELPHIAACPRILVTHYPICLANGTPEKRYHGLLNLHEMLRVVQECGISVWLHGHRHRPYEVFTSHVCTLPSICAGSGTQEGLWSYAEYTLDGESWTISRRQYEPGTAKFAAGASCVWSLPS
jgi:3',5'-cyclic AMP phosphodiesterase CpdA